MTFQFTKSYRVLLHVLAVLAICHSTRLGFGADAKQEDSQAESQAQFQRLRQSDWHEVFFDTGAGNWRDKWFLDGQVGQVSNTNQGMELRAGSEFRDDAHHMVLWTKQSFSGDLKIEFEYTRLDSEKRCVNILYIQATGSGVGPYAKDISRWTELRRVPAMNTYFNHMQTYHISYAAYPNNAAGDDYIRARRYMPESKGLRGTDLTPDYFKTGLFKTNVPHGITVIKHGPDLFMHIRGSGKEMLCHWKNDSLPPITTGRIGLRHMYTRSARYRDFRISVPQHP